jgi:hypothetical protein
MEAHEQTSVRELDAMTVHLGVSFSSLTNIKGTALTVMTPPR